MKEAERIVALVAAAIAVAAERCAADLEAKQSELSGPEALRNFAAAIRETNRDFSDTIHATVH